MRRDCLYSVNFIASDLSDKSLAKMLKTMPQLNQVSFSNCHPEREQDTLANGVENSHLTSITFDNCKGLVHFILPLLKGCVQTLQILKIEHNYYVQVLQSLSQQYHALHTLSFDGSSALTHGGFLEFAELCPSLTSLNVNHCKDISNGYLSAYTSKCKQLTNLECRYCHMLHTNMLNIIADHCENLVSFRTSGYRISFTSLFILISKCQKIELISIDYMNMVSALDVYDISTKKCCVNGSLHTIAMCDNAQINDTVMKTIGECVPNLKLFTITRPDAHEKRFTDNGVAYLLYKCIHLKEVTQTEKRRRKHVNRGGTKFMHSNRKYF